MGRFNIRTLFNFLSKFLFLSFITVSLSIPVFGTSNNQCGTSADADVVIMIDKTGSINTSEMTEQKNAAKTLLNFFNTAVVKPRVAIGTFNVQNGPDARIQTNGNLSDMYGHDNPNDIGLYEVINNIPSAGTGSTDVSAALMVAQAELAAHAQSSNRYIIIISDGITNEPDANSPSNCSGGNPGAAASAAANAAEAAGTKIIAIHFGDDSGCASGTGINFLKNIIATAPALFHKGNDKLADVFAEISVALVCDDGNACTLDTCSDGKCVSVAIDDDFDGDGVFDCVDECPGGDDSKLGNVCSAGIGGCFSQGQKICLCNGNPWLQGTTCQIVCDAQPGQPKAEKCNFADDDCDSLMDEDFPVGNTCMVGTGACMNTGQFVCNQYGNGVKCNVNPGNPSSEVCNGLDDDCDGVIDNIPPSGSCTDGIGACQAFGQFICFEGTFICNAVAGDPELEVCDGIDNDCNGQTDEIFDACGVQCGDGSSCVTPTPTATATPTPSTTPSPTATPTDGCDGIIDECGICDGDGTSCTCTEVDLQSEITAIDASSLALYKIGRYMAHVSVAEVKKGQGKEGLSVKKAKKIVKKKLAQASVKHIESWNFANTGLVSKSTSCGAAFECNTIGSLSTTVTSLIANNGELLKIFKEIRKALGVKSNPQVQFVFEAVKKVAQENLAAINSYPKNVTGCEPIVPLPS